MRITIMTDYLVFPVYTYATDKKLVLFFGQKGISFLNSKNGKMSKLKDVLSSRTEENTYYTSNGAKFSHPSRCKKTFLLKKFDSKILDQ